MEIEEKGTNATRIITTWDSNKGDDMVPNGVRGEDVAIALKPWQPGSLALKQAKAAGSPGVASSLPY